MLIGVYSVSLIKTHALTRHCNDESDRGTGIH